MPEGMDYGGFVMPYADSPLDGGKCRRVGVPRYFRTFTPVCAHHDPVSILDDTTLAALKFAAKRGVEVIIIMPHIPDKLYAYLLARSYYAELLRAGVQIYEYTPGFIHAKMFTSDDEKAVVGTINLDFRSLYLHFECASYFFRNAVVMDVEEDFQKTLARASGSLWKTAGGIRLSGGLRGRHCEFWRRLCRTSKREIWHIYVFLNEKQG